MLLKFLSEMIASGIEIPETWMSTIKKHSNRRATQYQTLEETTCQNNGNRNIPIIAAKKSSQTQQDIVRHKVMGAFFHLQK